MDKEEFKSKTFNFLKKM